jgi:hypothetical protein
VVAAMIICNQEEAHKKLEKTYMTASRNIGQEKAVIIIRLWYLLPMLHT